LYVLSSKRGVAAAVLAVVIAGSASAQQPGGMVVQNPLDEIRSALARTLETAGVPFTDTQVQAISLAMDEQRRATEELFGQVLDFSGGPPQGAQRDRALAAIEWMTTQFLASLDAVLTPPQAAAWLGARQEGGVPAIARLGAAATVASQSRGGRGGGAGRGGTSQQIAQVRINNNPFTAESIARGRGRGTLGAGSGTAEVITRGGVGDYHGNANFTYQNDGLNARNAFAANKPPYARHNIDGGFNGPVLSNRLTVGVTGNENHEASVDTIAARIPGGIVSEGISRPTLTRKFGGTGELQASERVNVHLATNYTLTRRANEDVGGIRLRERARHSESSVSTSTMRSIAPLSSSSLLDVTVGYERNRTENRRISQGVAINVADGFEGGGATDHNRVTSGTATLQSLFIHTAERLTTKAGLDLSRRRSRSLTENAFNGLFEFASLEDFIAGRPTTYTVSIGDPLLDLTHVEAAVFTQNDVRLSRRLTLMFGLRYEAQNNLHDWNNFDPRFGYAYSLNDSTVLRGGIGLFHERLTAVIVERLLRLDGVRQQELVVTAPSYPNPFLAGTANLKSSVRIASPELEALSNLSWQASVERTLPGNAQATVSYEHNLGRDEYRTLNLNAPRPGELTRPDPTRGNILELQSSGRSTGKILRFTARQRLRALTISGNYILASELEDGDAQTTFNPPSNSYDLSADWGRGDDRVHQFTASVNAQLPLGVFLTVSTQALSGEPYTITTGRDDNHDTVSNDRPPGVPRHSATGPGLQSTNINLSKVFFLRRTAASGGQTGSAGAQVNVFANIFNALNQTNFDRISGVLTSSRFGRPISAADPREIEIGMRFQF
jgi:hypothetical protein